MLPESSNFLTSQLPVPSSATCSGRGRVNVIDAHVCPTWLTLLQSSLSWTVLPTPMSNRALVDLGIAERVAVGDIRPGKRVVPQGLGQAGRRPRLPLFRATA